MGEKFCPCCGRHCSLDNPHCGRGAEFAETGVVPEGRGRHGAHREEKYQEFDSDDKLMWNIREMGHAVRGFSDGKASQNRILILLYGNDGITQSELTALLGVQPGTVSEVIGKLERAGLIVRTASDKDKRTSTLSLTESGRERAEQAAAERCEITDDAFSCLTEEEKIQLISLLEKVNYDWHRSGRHGHRHGHEGHEGHGHRHGHGHDGHDCGHHREHCHEHGGGRHCGHHGHHRED